LSAAGLAWLCASDGYRPFPYRKQGRFERWRVERQQSIRLVVRPTSGTLVPAWDKNCS